MKRITKKQKKTLESLRQMSDTYWEMLDKIYKKADFITKERSMTGGYTFDFIHGQYSIDELLNNLNIEVK